MREKLLKEAHNKINIFFQKHAGEQLPTMNQLKEMNDVASPEEIEKL